MRMLHVLSAAALAVLACVKGAEAVTQYTPAALADQITALPGLAVQPSFNQFAGYLTVDVASNRSIFYWYTESQSKPETDPTIWWSNGGPGCSGLLGFLTEHGPFRPSQAGDGGLEVNKFAWNTMANTLYVEAPAGVGFSFSNNPNDYNTGDAQTAADNYVAITLFFQRFPHLKTNEFYISAESYGGHYVPQLALQLVQRGGVDNFRGFLLGNPYTDVDENANWGQGATVCGHSLASNPSCTAFQQHCLTSPPGGDDQCNAAQSEVVGEAGALDMYGLDFPTCPQGGKTMQQRRLLNHVYGRRKHTPGFSAKLKAQLDKMDGTVPLPYDPCSGNEETTYLNRNDVRAAIHASPAVDTWLSCSSSISYNQTDGLQPMEPLYTELLKVTPPLRMVIFSGDDDTICASLGTQHWMYNMFGSEVVSPWTNWNYVSEEYGSQIAGFGVKFKGISFVTVHGAGHMVSQYRPEKGLAVLQNFLSGAFSAEGPMTEKQPAVEQKQPEGEALFKRAQSASATKPAARRGAKIILSEH